MYFNGCCHLCFVSLDMIIFVCLPAGIILTGNEMKSVSTRKWQEREWKCNMFLENVFVFFWPASENYWISFFLLFLFIYSLSFIYLKRVFIVFIISIIVVVVVVFHCFIFVKFKYSCFRLMLPHTCHWLLTTAVFMSPKKKLLLFGIFMYEICKWKGF